MNDRPFSIAEPGWSRLLERERARGYFAALEEFVGRAYAEGTVYPPRERIFAAFELTPFETTKVVILGQDPYHEPGEAQGLAFYVPETVKTPPSLRNIAKELAAEYPDSLTTVPDLRDWARQGVLLLNTTLTVAAGAPMSHAKRGWETFTDAVIAELDARREHLVFVLWGAHAQKKGELVDRGRHCVIECAHPSPLSARRGFFGSGCFLAANRYLVRHGVAPIGWV